MTDRPWHAKPAVWINLRTLAIVRTEPEEHAHWPDIRQEERLPRVPGQLDTWTRISSGVLMRLRREHGPAHPVVGEARAKLVEIYGEQLVAWAEGTGPQPAEVAR